MIEVKGNPMTTRSYMYPADLVKVLLQLPIVNGNDPINIGSNVPITMQELALLISDMTSNKGVYFSKPESIVNQYVPSTTNLEKAIGNLRFDPLETALEKWIQWLKS
jgi:nucleoside-diphosphate-sugar epimerase